jgi:hypothetical protein
MRFSAGPSARICDIEVFVPSGAAALSECCKPVAQIHSTTEGVRRRSPTGRTHAVDKPSARTQLVVHTRSRNKGKAAHVSNHREHCRRIGAPAGHRKPATAVEIRAPVVRNRARRRPRARLPRAPAVGIRRRRNASPTISGSAAGGMSTPTSERLAWPAGTVISGVWRTIRALDPHHQSTQSVILPRDGHPTTQCSRERQHHDDCSTRCLDDTAGLHPPPR